MSATAVQVHPRRCGRVPAALIATALIVVLPPSRVGAKFVDLRDPAVPVRPSPHLTGPHILSDDIAGVIVRVRGGGNCTGTPITGTRFVVTAAHCVLDPDGLVGARSVLRDGVAHRAVSVLVDPAYHDSPSPRLDAAVLVMTEAIPGPSATVGHRFPLDGQATLAGLQPLDTDGSLLRGTRYDNRPRPKGAGGSVIAIRSTAVGCLHLVSELEITDVRVSVPCGLIPGASGGGLFVQEQAGLSLVGIISTVAPDLAYNGVVPLASVHELLDNPSRYTYEMPTFDLDRARSNVVRA